MAEKERAQQLGQMTNQIANLVAEMSVNSDTMRPYSIQAIEGAIKQEINFSVNVNRSAKQQALLVSGKWLVDKWKVYISQKFDCYTV